MSTGDDRVSDRGQTDQGDDEGCGKSACANAIPGQVVRGYRVFLTSYSGWVIILESLRRFSSSALVARALASLRIRRVGL